MAKWKQQWEKRQPGFFWPCQGPHRATIPVRAYPHIPEPLRSPHLPALLRRARVTSTALSVKACGPHKVCAGLLIWTTQRPTIGGQGHWGRRGHLRHPREGLSSQPFSTEGFVSCWSRLPKGMDNSITPVGVWGGWGEVWGLQRTGTCTHAPQGFSDIQVKRPRA